MQQFIADGLRTLLRKSLALRLRCIRIPDDEDVRVAGCIGFGGQIGEVFLRRWLRAVEPKSK
jgi:hypothetical protein